MQIRIEIVKREGDIPDAERQAVHVESHSRRNDAFVTQKVDTIMEGSDAVLFNVPDGGRLVINTPYTHEEMVYDRDQMASVRLSQQTNPANRGADQALRRGAMAPGVPSGQAVPPNPADTQGLDAASRTPPVAPVATPPGTVAGAPANQAQSGRRFQPQNQVDTAKEQQQGGAPRPPGESPPKPGSPVGSPPDGNEGQK